MITLRQLRYLEALAQHRHFGRAAEACAVTQPALSMQIRELERELKIDLVERRAGSIELTETGVEVARARRARSGRRSRPCGLCTTERSSAERQHQARHHSHACALRAAEAAAG